jgi:CheY-like chemotaxis protein
MLDLILCVDDDTIASMLCKMVITKTSFSNETVTAAESIKKPQLIFLDLNMPIMGGWEFLNSFNTGEYSDFHDISVIILSSTIDPEDLEKAKKYPMVIDFLSKPISKEMLEYIKTKIQE